MRKKFKIILGAVFGIAFSAMNIIGLPGGKTAQAAEVAIDETNFPDRLFRDYIKTNIDKDKNNMLSNDEITTTTEISIRITGGNRVSSLNGIEYFTSLTRLDCTNNSLTELDLSKNIALEELYCPHNKLTKLNVSKNILLKVLDCNSNQLTNLDVSKNIALENFAPAFNPLTEIDLSNNTELDYFSCENCQLLTKLNLSNNKKLRSLYCQKNQITELDLSNNTELLVY